MITASVVQDWMYRGSSYTLVVQILDDGEPYPIPLTYEAVLRLSLSSTYPRSVVEKAAKFYSRNNGIVHFEFTPQTQGISLLQHTILLFIMMMLPK